MWRSPAFFHEYLNQQGLVGDLYDAIQKDDLSEAVGVALNILKKTGNIPPLVKVEKCKSKSANHRQEGNKAYRERKYQAALHNYNKALAFAPKGSEELVLAYSNRSALLATCKMFEACLKDITTCFSLGCPSQITEKLSKRREEAMQGLWMEQMEREVRFDEFAEGYFLFDERKNPQISCASTDIGVIMQSKIPKIVATRDVKVGKVIALEKAFVTVLDRKLLYTACYYCNQMNPNLIPCEGCCSALFCDSDCQKKCFDEYHAVECPIVELLDQFLTSLGVKAAIKLKNQFKTWEEFNEATFTVGLKRMKKSEINDIFDGENKFSMLNFKDDSAFKYGSIYNAAFCCAMIIHYLGNVHSFMPRGGQEKSAAIRGFSRALMYYSTNLVQTQIQSTVSVMVHGRTQFSDHASFGIFPFTGKLKGACNPNVLLAGLNNQVALIALQPLKPGMELTIAQLGHWLDGTVDSSLRWRNMFSMFGTACSCPVCNGDWKLLRDNTKPTETHLRCVRKLNIPNLMRSFESTGLEAMYPKCCKTLAFLSDIPFSNLYTDVFKLFRKCLLDIQDQYSSNIMLDCNEHED